MKLHIDTQIQQLLEGYVEQPPTACWDKLSERLDMLNSPTGGNPSSGGGGGSAAAGQAAVGTIGKVAIGLAAAAIAVTGMIFRTNSDKPTENKSQTSIIQPVCQPKEENTNQPQGNHESVKSDYPATAVVEQSNSSTSAHYAQEESIETPTNQAQASSSESIAFSQPMSIEDKPQSKINQSPSTEQPVPEGTKSIKPVAQSTHNSHKNKEQTAETLQQDAHTSTTPAEETPKQPELQIPNLITPNGDGLNDVFVITGIEEIPQNQLIVFNRNSKIVYECNRYTNQWTAEDLPAGVYFYIFKFSYQGNEFMRKGSITVAK